MKQYNVRLMRYYDIVAEAEDEEDALAIADGDYDFNDGNCDYDIWEV